MTSPKPMTVRISSVDLESPAPSAVMMIGSNAGYSAEGILPSKSKSKQAAVANSAWLSKPWSAVTRISPESISARICALVLKPEVNTSPVRPWSRIAMPTPSTP